MKASDILRLVGLILVLYLAFRVGAFILRILLILVAVGLVVWAVASLFRRRRRR